MSAFFAPAFFAPLVEVLNRPEAWAYLPASYLAGSIPFGLILALMVGKKDVRAAGSGNIGATNVARVVGKKLGLVTLFLDALKGAAPVAATFLLDLPEGQRVLLAAAAGLCAFLGHCFPVWLKFRGGKGVATGAGVMLAHLPVVAAVGIGAFAIVFAISKKVSLGSLTGAAAIVVSLPLLVPFDVSVVVVLVMFAVLVLRHLSNIKRLLRKEELKV